MYFGTSHTVVPTGSDDLQDATVTWARGSAVPAARECNVRRPGLGPGGGCHGRGPHGHGPQFDSI
jgi:hypothetical protein